MPSLKIAVELAGLRQPFKKALLTAAELGVQAVEIDARGELSPRELSQTGVRQVRKMLDDLHLRVAAVSFRPRRGYASQEDLDQRIDATKAAIDLAHHLGTSVLVVALGPIPSAEHEPAARQTLRDVLTDLGRYGQRNGALLAAETGTESGKALAGLLAELPEGTLGIDLNPGQLLVHGHSPLEAVHLLGRSILHVHVSDALRGPAPNRDEYVGIGRGHADFPALMGALDESHYQGYFTIQPQAGTDAVRQAGAAIEYLRGL